MHPSWAAKAREKQMVAARPTGGVPGWLASPSFRPVADMPAAGRGRAARVLRQLNVISSPRCPCLSGVTTALIVLLGEDESTEQARRGVAPLGSVGGGIMSCREYTGRRLTAMDAGTKVVFGDDGEAAAPAPLASGQAAAPVVGPAAASHASSAAARPPPSARGRPGRSPSAGVSERRQLGTTAAAAATRAVPGRSAAPEAAAAPARREARRAGLPRTAAAPLVAARRLALAKSHPSWEAKAKLRLQMSALPKPQGVKTVFDD